MDTDGLRIGNAERDEAVRLLQRQADDGRLDSNELAQRTSQVRAAKTRQELAPAFQDLPVDVPTMSEGAFPLYPGTDPVTGAATTNESQALAVPTESTVENTCTADEDRLETSQPMKRIGSIVIALLWPAAFVLNMVFGWQLWWLFLVPLFASGWIAYAFGLGGRPDGKGKH